MGRMGWGIVTCVAGIALTVSASAYQLDILSGTYSVNELFQGWYSTSDKNVVGNIGSLNSPGAWTQVNFDQSKWGSVVVVTNPNITPQTIVPGTAAQFIGEGPQPQQGAMALTKCFSDLTFL